MSHRKRGAVVKSDDGVRTQNGHIRNDTRDASQRILDVSFDPICRKNCAASDRECTRVTLLNLHGKEGVNGSSPLEGSAKAPEIGAFSFGSTCGLSNVSQVWSPLWSLQVENAFEESRVRGPPRAYAVISAD
jgi:hypothetical protein